MEYPSLKSTGIIFSTGSGSTGQLNSIKRLTPENYSDVANDLGVDISSFSEQEMYSRIEKIGKKNQFPPDSNFMLYKHREIVHDYQSAQNPISGERHFIPEEGKCKKVIVDSASLQASMFTDSRAYDLEFGDRIEISMTSKDNWLKVMSVNL